MEDDVATLTRFLKRCEAHGTRVLISELNARAGAVLDRMDALEFSNVETIASYEEAVARAGEIMGA